MQTVGILELIDQDVLEPLLVMRAQGLVTLQQLMTAQQQFGKITHPFAIALGFVLGIEIHTLLRVMVIHLGLRRPDPLFLVRIDEVAELARRIFFIVHAEVFLQALDHGELVAAVENLEGLRQPRLAVVRAQHAVAQAVKSADPHPAHIDRHLRRQPRRHLARRLVGKGHRQQGRRPHLIGR